MYHALSQQVEQQGFLEKLQQAKDVHASAHASQVHGAEVLTEDWWKVPHEDAPSSLSEDEAGFAKVRSVLFTLSPAQSCPIIRLVQQCPCPVMSSQKCLEYSNTCILDCKGHARAASLSCCILMPKVLVT